jgi:hypothetical protein
MPKEKKPRSSSKKRSQSRTRGRDGHVSSQASKHSRSSKHSRHHSRAGSRPSCSERSESETQPRRSHSRVEREASHTNSSVAQSLPVLSSVQYGREGRHSTNTSFFSPVVVLPALHASTDEGYIPPTTRCRRRAESAGNARSATTVTIPRGLLPKEVPRPLRAVERRGKAPTKPRGSLTSNDDLYTRWVNAYTYGTASEGEYSFYRFSDKSLEPETGDGRGEAGSSQSAVERLLSPSSSNMAEEAQSLPAVPKKVVNITPSTLPESFEGSDPDSMESWMDGAGYFFVSGRFVDSRSGRAAPAKKEVAEADGGVGATTEKTSVPLASASAPAVSAASVKLLHKQQPQQPTSELRRSLPQSVAPFQEHATPLQSNSESNERFSITPPSITEDVAGSYKDDLNRVWTPSPIPSEEERGLPSTQELLYPMAFRGGNTSTIDAEEPATLQRQSSGRFVKPPPPPPPPSQERQPPQRSQLQQQQLPPRETPRSALTSTSVVKSVPFMEDGLAPDPDMSDNDSRHFVSVSRLAAATDGASSSAGSLWLPGDGESRDMGDDADEDVEGRDSNQDQQRSSFPIARPTRQHATLEPTLLAISRSGGTMSPFDSTASTTMPQTDDFTGTVGASTSRFRRNEFSAAVLGAQRVLTLLVLQDAPTPPRVTRDGTQVTLPAPPSSSAASGGTKKTVTVDEAVCVSKGDSFTPASLLRSVAEEMRDGHCAALLLSVGAGCGAAGCAVVETTLSLLLAATARRQAEAQSEYDGMGAAATVGEGDFYSKMEVSITLVHKGKYTKDLIVNREEELGSWALTRPISNPLLGSWCDNTLFQSVRSPGQITTLLQPVQAWLSKSPEEVEKAKEVVCIYVALRQVRHLTAPAEQRTLTLSSLIIYLSRGQGSAVNVLRNRAGATALQRSLLRRVCDGCFTVAAACVRCGAARANADVTLTADACTLRNNGFVSGDAGRYISTLRNATAKEAWTQANVGDELERQRALQRLELRCDLLRSMLCLLQDPADCTIPFYPDRIASREEAEAKAAQAEHNSPAGTSMSSGMLLQGILSSTGNIHIPGIAEAVEMFSDCRVHTVAIRSAKKACGYELMSGTDDQLMRLANGATFSVDELRPRRILPPLHTLPIATQTSALCTLFTNGYNAAIASFDGRSSNVFSSPVWYVLAEAIDRALNRPDVQRREVRIAFSVVHGSGEAMDLMDPESTMTPLQVASSPLFGTAVYASQMHPVTSPDTLRKLLYTVAPKAASMWTPNAFLHVLLVNLFSTADDVFVSSFNLSVFGSHATLCQRVLSNGKGIGEAESNNGNSPPLHPEVLRLHYGLLSGAAASVFLVSLNNHEDSDSAMTMVERYLPPLHKAVNRSGSVTEFIRRTRNGLEKRRLTAQSAPVEERAYLARMERRITDMLDDNASLLVPDSQAFPKAYLTEQVVVSSPSAQQTRRQAANAAAAPPPPVQQQARAAPIAHNGKYDSKAMAPRELSAESGVSVFPQGPSSGKGSALDCASEAATSTAMASVSHPQWVLGVELGGCAAMEVQASGTELEWVPTHEHFDTDCILFFNSAQSDAKYLFTDNCAPMQRLREAGRAARSCAILGLVDGGGGAPDLHVRTQPLWRSFAALVLNSAFVRDNAGATWKDGSELHIRMCAVQDRTLLYDFLLDDENTATELPAKVALAVNPLFGPVVRNTTVMRAGNISECQCVLRSGLDALNNLAGEYPSGTVIIASAVLKNVTADDIFFSSISAFGVRIGKDLPALRDILAMDPKGGAPPSLYQYALRGPCHLLCLTSLDSSANVHCVEALRLSQGIRYGTSAPVPAGSLRKCLLEQQDMLTRGGTTEQARTNARHVVGQLAKMMSDPCAPIVVFPFDDDAVLFALSSHDTYNLLYNGSGGNVKGGSGDPVTTSLASLRTAAGGANCRVTAIITATARGETSTLEARTETNTVHAAQTSYPFSEVVLRANNSSVLRPGLISSIVQQVQQGRNTALVVADGVGSNAGASLLSKLVSMFIRNTGDNGHGVNTTLLMSVTAVRFPAAGGGSGAATAMVKDLFSAETQFYPLQVARSPFFGPCVDGARFSSLNRIGDVYLTLKDAQKACCFLKATLVVAIVLKQVTRSANGSVQDVLMSSLFSVISTAETSNGVYACKVFDDMLNQREAALAAPSPDDPRAVAWRGCLLAQAFGGESFTYGVVGLTASAKATEVAAMMKFGSRLMQVTCRVPPKSSAVDILQRANQKLVGGKGGPASAAAAEETPTGVLIAPWDWREIKAEAEEMLKSPDTCKPRAFLCD